MFQNAAGASGARNSPRPPGPVPQPGKQGGSAFAAQAGASAPHWRQCPSRSPAHKSFAGMEAQGLRFQPPDAPNRQPDAAPAGPQAASGSGGGYRSPFVEDCDEDDQGDETGGAGPTIAGDPFAPVGAAGRDGHGGSGGEHESGQDAPHPDGLGAAGFAPRVGKRKRADYDKDYESGGEGGRPASVDLGAFMPGLASDPGDDDDDDDEDNVKANPAKRMRGDAGSLGRHANHVKGLSKAWEKGTDNLNEAQQNDEPLPTEEDFAKYDQGAFERNADLGAAAAAAIDAPGRLTANNGMRDHLNPDHPVFKPLLAGIDAADKAMQNIKDDEVFEEPVMAAVRDMIAEQIPEANPGMKPEMFREGSTSKNLMIPDFHLDCVAQMKNGTFKVADAVNMGGGEFFSHMSDYNHRRHIPLGQAHKLQPREMYQAERLSPIIHILGEVCQYYKNIADESIKGYEAYADRLPIDPATGKPVSAYFLTPEGQFFKGFIAAFLDFDCALLGNFFRHTVYRGQSFKASWNQVISQILWSFGEETAAGSSGGEDRKNKSEARVFNRSLKSKSVRQKDGMIRATKEFDGGRGFDIRRHADRFDEFCGDVYEKYVKERLDQMIQEDSIRAKADTALYDRNDESTRDYVSHADAVRAKAMRAKFDRAEAEPDPEKRNALFQEVLRAARVDPQEDPTSAGDPANFDGTGPDGVYAAPPKYFVPDIGHEDEGYYFDD